ncbi:MAG: hypothetical protein QOH23_1814 [Gaiellaceae bacterium]|jgi:hypothetical protein|nr:hypothetical protein [Gaiellaceae bacterium]
MSRRRVLASAALTVLAVIAAVIAATRGGASERGALSRLSNEGRPVALVDGNVWRPAGVGNVTLLATRGTRTVYSLESKEGPCVGAGPANVPGKLGTVDCPRGPFPTAEQPVLDLSVYEATSHESHEVSLYRAEGVAADGVVTIAFLRPNGTVALKVPVHANVYEEGSIPPGPVSSVLAYDAAGKELWRSP